MRRPVTVAMSVLTAGVVALSLRSSVHQQAPTARGLAPAGVDGGGSSGSSPTGHPPSTATGARGGHRASARSATESSVARVRVTGQGEQTPYGPVQVQITLLHDRIVDARALAHPSGGHSTDINAAAVPVLDQETVQSQGKQVDAVSGATYTSEGYQQSLQSALDAAHRHRLI